MKITQNEFQVLQAIDASEYGDWITDAVWSFTIADNSTLPKRSIPGIVASLSKKKLVSCQDGSYGDEHDSLGMTEKGVEVYFREAFKRGQGTRKIRPAKS